MSKKGKEALLLWCKRSTEGYKGVEIKNFHTSWADGLAFCALIHRYQPSLIGPFENLKASEKRKNLDLAFKAANEAGIPPLLDIEDLLETKPEPLSIITYLSQFYHIFHKSGRYNAINQTPPTSNNNEVVVEENENEECCHKCGKILEGAVIEVMGQMYHEDCFGCFECGKELTGKCLNVNNNPYCESCGRKAFLQQKRQSLPSKKHDEKPLPTPPKNKNELSKSSEGKPNLPSKNNEEKKPPLPSKNNEEKKEESKDQKKPPPLPIKKGVALEASTVTPKKPPPLPTKKDPTLPSKNNEEKKEEQVKKEEEEKPKNSLESEQKTEKLPKEDKKEEEENKKKEENEEETYDKPLPVPKRKEKPPPSIPSGKSTSILSEKTNPQKKGVPILPPKHESVALKKTTPFFSDDEDEKPPARLPPPSPKLSKSENNYNDNNLRERTNTGPQIVPVRKSIRETITINTDEKKKIPNIEAQDLPNLEGYMEKKGDVGLIKSFKRRYFVLKGDRLIYYEDQQAKTNDNPLGFVPLYSASTFEIVTNKPGMFFIVTTSPERTWYLKCEHYEEMNKWLNACIIHSKYKPPQVKVQRVLPERPANREGYLEKLAGGISGQLQTLRQQKEVWNTRYFVLKDGILWKYKVKGEGKPAKIPLYKCTLEEFTDEGKEMITTQFQVSTNTKTAILRAKNEEEMHAWLNSILKHKIAIETEISQIEI